MIAWAALIFALAFGCAAVWKGNRRSAIPLLASAALSVSFCLLGVPFNFYFWLMIDLAVVVAIWHEEMTRKDMAIVVLFFPAWLNYALTGEAPYFWVSWAIVMAQFGLTLPLERIAHAARQVVSHQPPVGPDLLVAA